MKSRHLNPALILVIASLLSTLAVAQQRRFSGGRGGNGSGGAGGAGLTTFRITPASMPSGEKWEYGFLEITTTSAAAATRPGERMIWRGPANEQVEATTFVEIYKKLGGSVQTPAFDDELPIWNLLGEKGWEFVARDVHPVGLNASGDERVIVRFKRARR